MTKDKTELQTAVVADFLGKGRAAQKAVDDIISGYNQTTKSQMQTMEPISDLSSSEFKELRDGYLEDGHGADAPSLTDALELIRTGISAVLEISSLDDPREGARHDLATLLDIATWALVMESGWQEQTEIVCRRMRKPNLSNLRLVEFPPRTVEPEPPPPRDYGA